MNLDRGFMISTAESLVVLCFHADFSQRSMPIAVRTRFPILFSSLHPFLVWANRA